MIEARGTNINLYNVYIEIVRENVLFLFPKVL